MVWRRSRASSRVCSSTYSRVAPAGRPRAGRVTFTPRGESSSARYRAVVLPGRSKSVATMTSATPPFTMRSFSRSMERSSGITPSRGEMAPPSTW